MAQEKRQSFMKGAVILSAATLIVKVLGLLFSIPLANIISTRSMSYFYTAYDIFGMFLLLSTAGLPIAVSRMVGTAYTRGRKKEADRVFSVAFWLFFTIGLAGCLVMFFGADWIAGLMGNPGAGYAIMALAPTMFFISVMSSLRGYFQGRSNMVPTAVSQIIEAVSKVIIGIGLAMYILNRYDADAWAPVGAIIGVSISAGLGVIYLVMYKLRQKKLDAGHPDDTFPVSTGKDILRELVRIAVPITIGSCFLSVLDLVDTAILMSRLQEGLGFSAAVAESLRGLLGHARKFFDLPGAFVVPISTSLLPVLSGAIAAGDEKNTHHIASISMRVTLLIAIPSSVGMVLFATPICQLLLFNNQEAATGTAPLLAVLALAIAFSALLFTTNAILQSFDKARVPVINMGIGGVLKVILSYVLISIPGINVMGSAISTVVSYLVIVTLNIICVRRCMPKMQGVVSMALPMVLSAGVMAVAAYVCYWALSFVLSPKIAVIPAILVAVAVYAVCAVFFKAVTYEDVIMLPRGQQLAKILHVSPKETHLK